LDFLFIDIKDYWDVILLIKGMKINKLLPLIFLSTLCASEFTLSVGVAQVQEEYWVPQKQWVVGGFDNQVWKSFSNISPIISIETKIWFLSTSLEYFNYGYDYEWKLMPNLFEDHPDGVIFIKKERIDFIQINTYLPFTLNNFTFSIGGMVGWPFNINKEVNASATFPISQFYFYEESRINNLDACFGPSFKMKYRFIEFGNIKISIYSAFDYSLREWLFSRNKSKLSFGLGFTL